MFATGVLPVWRKCRGVRADMKAWMVRRVTVSPGLFVSGDSDLAPITRLTHVHGLHKAGKAICFPCDANISGKEVTTARRHRLGAFESGKAE